MIGWLLLRGRCRDCAAPISARYPLVEAGCGVLVTAIAALDIVYGGVDRMLSRGEWLPWAHFAFHGITALTLVAWVLIAAAGGRVPSTAALGAVMAAGLAAIAVPAVLPWGVLPTGGPWPAEQPRLAALVAWAAGTAAGWVASGGAQSRFHAAVTLLGAAGGWQMVTVVTAVAAASRLGRRWAERITARP